MSINPQTGGSGDLNQRKLTDDYDPALAHQIRCNYCGAQANGPYAESGKGEHEAAISIAENKMCECYHKNGGAIITYRIDCPKKCKGARR